MAVGEASEVQGEEFGLTRVEVEVGHPDAVGFGYVAAADGIFHVALLQLHDLEGDLGEEVAVETATSKQFDGPSPDAGVPVPRGDQKQDRDQPDGRGGHETTAGQKELLERTRVEIECGLLSIRGTP
jgi:hypothetical protein